MGQDSKVLDIGCGAGLYSKDLGITTDAGRHLAEKRFRWAKNVIGLSLQCLTFSHLSNSFKEFFESKDDESDIIPITCECRILESFKSHNLLKSWKLDIKGEELTAISFNWRHQGMGSDAKIDDGFVLKAYILNTIFGKIVFLKDENSYILPANLL